MPKNNFIFLPTHELWPTESVNARVPPVVVSWADKPISASIWLRIYRTVDQWVWAPGHSQSIKNGLLVEGGWIDKDNVTAFNSYRPPTLVRGDPTKAQPWLDHLERIYPEGKDHIIHWMAHHIQHPGVKVNHGLLLGGAPNVGKDTLLEPLRQAVGPWNFGEISPKQAMGRFNKFARNIILRISEARDLGEFDRYAFHDHIKVYMAAPPDTLYIDEKHLGEYYILNCVGVIITTNNKFDSLLTT
jgi:hypothetical protein